MTLSHLKEEAFLSRKQRESGRKRNPFVTNVTLSQLGSHLARWRICPKHKKSPHPNPALGRVTRHSGRTSYPVATEEEPAAAWQETTLFIRNEWIGHKMRSHVTKQGFWGKPKNTLHNLAATSDPLMPHMFRRHDPFRDIMGHVGIFLC